MNAESSSSFADVTVIIPAYKAAETIARALASIFAQTVKPRAVVVVDDGSPDGTLAATEAQRDHMGDIEFVVVSQPNAGPGAARNRALMEAQTEYVAFLDADDEWMPEKLSRSMSQIRAGNYVLVAHDSLEVDGSHIHRLECARRFRAGAATPFHELYKRGFIDTTTVVARLDAVRAVGGFDITLPNAQDFELWLAILAQPYVRYLVFDEVLSRYHRIPGSVMSHVARRKKCCIEIACRYAPVLKNHPGRPLASVWFRMIAISRESVAAYVKVKNFAMALWTILTLPADMIVATASYFSRTGTPKPRLLG